jgi:hypothetical protein
VAMACMAQGCVDLHDLGTVWLSNEGVWAGDVSMTWVMRVAWGCIGLYDLGWTCGLGICRLVRPGLHVRPGGVCAYVTWVMRMA